MTVRYEQLLELIHTRRSVRRFSDAPVSTEQIDRVLEAARWAPSAGNRQAWRFFVVRSRDRIDAMADAVQRASARLVAESRPEASAGLRAYVDYFHHFSGAPVVIVPLYRAGLDLLGTSAARPDGDAAVSSRARLEAVASVSAAIANLLLAAHALGLAACWMTGPLIAERELARILDVPEGWEVAAVIPVGHAADTPAAPGRRPLERIRKDL